MNYELLTKISSIALPLSFKASGIVQTPSCDYATKIEHTVTPSLSILTAETSASSGDLSVNIQSSNDRSKKGTYSLEIKPVIIGYTYTQPPASSTITLQVLDPCLKTVISDLNVEDMIAFATYTAISQVSFNFTDSIDLLESTLDYCGTK